MVTKADEQPQRRNMRFTSVAFSVLGLRLRAWMFEAFSPCMEKGAVEPKPPNPEQRPGADFRGCAKSPTADDRLLDPKP